MRLNSRAMFWGAAIVAAISYAICAAFVALVPQTTTRFFGWMMHIDLTGLARHITWGSFLGGILCYSVIIGLLAGASAWAYNRLSVGMR